jgi:hypothetical protein
MAQSRKSRHRIHSTRPPLALTIKHRRCPGTRASRLTRTRCWLTDRRPSHVVRPMCNQMTGQALRPGSRRERRVTADPRRTCRLGAARRKAEETGGRSARDELLKAASELWEAGKEATQRRECERELLTNKDSAPSSTSKFYLVINNFGRLRGRQPQPCNHRDMARGSGIFQSNLCSASRRTYGYVPGQPEHTGLFG